MRLNGQGLKRGGLSGCLCAGVDARTTAGHHPTNEDLSVGAPVGRPALHHDDGGAFAGFLLDGFKGAVGVVEREGLHGGAEVEVAGECEEVARVLARHVGDAAELALTPEQAIVVEGGHLVEMNGVDGDDAAFAQSGERADDDFA